MRANLSVSIIVAISSALQLGLYDEDDSDSSDLSMIVDITGQKGVSKRPTGVGKKDSYVDEEWPAQGCCRLYTDSDFQISKANQNTDWADICADPTDDTHEPFALSNYVKNYKRGRRTGEGVDWDNIVNSFKCGTHVAITFCDNADTCEAEGLAESAAGGGWNPRMGESDMHSFVLLAPYDAREKFAATVYDNDDCSGLSHVIWIEPGQDSSLDEYSNVGESLQSQGNDKIESIRFPRGAFWMDLWEGDQFKLDDWWPRTTRPDDQRFQSVNSDEADVEGCVSIPNIGVTSLRWGKGLVQEYNQCCRLYTGYKYEGEHRDFCLSEQGSASFDFMNQSFEHKSYECGQNVRPTFFDCREEDDAGGCTEWKKVESARHGEAVNIRSTPRDKLTLKKVGKTGATLYRGARCQGRSFGTGGGSLEEDTYLGEKIRSAWLPAGSTLHLYAAGSESEIPQESLAGTDECVYFSEATAGKVEMFEFINN